jgi:tRNA modification GTPase
LRSLSGTFSQSIQAMQQQLTELRMRVEASLDFPEEEDIVEIEREKVRAGIQATLDKLDGVLGTARQGALLREGVHVALIGQPNVGKSSLMNALAGAEVSIVTEVAGTTRDALRQEVQVSGVSFHLVDTAGLRETTDSIERLGIARTWAAVEQAGMALLLVDSQHGLGEQERGIIRRLPPGIARMTVHNKIDLSGETARVGNERQSLAEKGDEGRGAEIWLSAKTGEGIDLLRAELLRSAGWQPAGEGGFMARRRHLEALARAQGRLRAAHDLFGQLELRAEELRLAQEALSEITGEVSADDLLGEIFSRFCIGK